MPIRSDRNLYPGINPHLNSALQQPGGGWRSFHARHLIYIADHIEPNLPDGYIIRPEESIQVSRLEDEFNPGPPRPSVPDILILRQLETSTPSSIVSPARYEAANQVIPIARFMDDPEDTLSGLVIYRDKQPVTRIELLSPANKPGGSHYPLYMDRRLETLVAGLRLVEIDYLHERRPISRDIASYRDRSPGAYPYHILVSDPRPSLEAGQTHIFHRGVLETLPVFSVPLEGQEQVMLDLGAVYNHTLSRRSIAEDIDYAQEPANMSAYTGADQAAIRAHMAQIAQEKRME
jgi:hypothetical protein